MDNSFRLYAKGDAFTTEHYDLRYLETIVTNYRRTIDSLLPIVLGQKTLTSRLQKEIKYNVKVNSGSLELLLDFAIENQDFLALFAIDGGVTLSKGISQLFKYILDFRRGFTKIIEAGLAPKMKIDANQTGDNGVQYNINTGDLIFNNPNIIIGAAETKPSLDRLITSVDGKNIETIDVDYLETKSRITQNDINLTGSQKEELPGSLELAGRLDMVAFSSHVGSIVTSQGRFPVKWDENLRDTIHSVADQDGVIFIVRPILDKRLFKDAPIAFHVIQCREPQTGIDGI